MVLLLYSNSTCYESIDILHAVRPELWHSVSDKNDKWMKYDTRLWCWIEDSWGRRILGSSSIHREHYCRWNLGAAGPVHACGHQDMSEACHQMFAWPMSWVKIDASNSELRPQVTMWEALCMDDAATKAYVYIVRTNWSSWDTLMWLQYSSGSARVCRLAQTHDKGDLSARFSHCSWTTKTICNVVPVTSKQVSSQNAVCFPSDSFRLRQCSWTLDFSWNGISHQLPRAVYKFAGQNIFLRLLLYMYCWSVGIFGSPFGGDGIDSYASMYHLVWLTADADRSVMTVRVEWLACEICRDV